MIAEIDWGIAIPAMITSLALAYTAVMSNRQGRQNQRHLREIVPKVRAIDHAVNGQPPGETPLVSNVQDISTEQERVKQELGEYKEEPDQWKAVNETLKQILVAVQANQTA